MDVSMLKTHLGDELYTQVEEKVGSLDGYTLIPTNDGSWLPKSKLDAEIQKRKEMQGTINTLTKDLNDANEKLSKSGTLQAQVDQLTKDLADRDSQITSMKRSSKIHDLLTKANAKDVSVVEKLLDESKITEDDKGELKGVTEQVDELKKSSPYLFSDGNQNHRGGFGDSKNHNQPSTPGSNDDVNAAIRAAAGRQ